MIYERISTAGNNRFRYDFMDKDSCVGNYFTAYIERHGNKWYVNDDIETAFVDAEAAFRAARQEVERDMAGYNALKAEMDFAAGKTCKITVAHTDTAVKRLAAEPQVTADDLRGVIGNIAHIVDQALTAGGVGSERAAINYYSALKRIRAHATALPA